MRVPMRRDYFGALAQPPKVKHLRRLVRFPAANDETISCPARGQFESELMATKTIPGPDMDGHASGVEEII
jgi:hypothetical protein